MPNKMKQSRIHGIWHNTTKKSHHNDAAIFWFCSNLFFSCWLLYQQTNRKIIEQWKENFPLLCRKKKKQNHERNTKFVAVIFLIILWLFPSHTHTHKHMSTIYVPSTVVVNLLHCTTSSSGLDLFFLPVSRFFRFVC